MEEKLLDEKAEEEFWRNYKKTRDPKIRDMFVKQYAPLVKYVAGKIAIGMPHTVEFDDLVGFGSGPGPVGAACDRSARAVCRLASERTVAPRRPEVAPGF